MKNKYYIYKEGLASDPLERPWTLATSAMRIQQKYEAEGSISLFIFHKVKGYVVEQDLDGREKGLRAGRAGGRKNSE